MSRKSIFKNVRFRQISIMGLLGLTVLTGCDKTREVLGLNRHQAHEFETIDRRPLEVPPSYDLRPPMPGEKSTRTKDGTEMAKEALGVSVSDSLKASSGEKDFLKAAQASEKDEDIRQKLLEDNDGFIEPAPGERLISSKPAGRTKGGRVIDPVEEQKKFADMKLEDNTTAIGADSSEGNTG